MSVRVTRPETNIAQKLSLIDDKISFEQLKTILAGPGGHLTVGNIKEWGPTSSACPLNVRLEQTSTYNNQVPSVHNSVLTLQNKYDSDTGNIAGTHSTIQFGVNGGQNSLGSISLVSEATETDSFPAGFRFCTQRANGSRPEAMRITGSGHVGIDHIVPHHKLTVANSTVAAEVQYVAGFYAGGSTSSSRGLKIYAGENTPTVAGHCVYVEFTDGDDTAAGGIRNSSSVSTPEFFSGSDVRMKKDIQDTDIQGVESIKQLKLRKWEWNTDKQTPATDIGLVADELETVFPELVSRTELSGWDHCVGEGEEQLKTIPSESKLTLTLIKAVQEQQAIIEQLQSRIDALENK